jgi:DNA-binding response OmpR family regulator
VLAVVTGDNSRMRLAIRELERQGISLVVVHSRDRTLEAADDFDLVLLDLDAPDKQGADLCRALRERSDVPIIVVSAPGTASDRISLFELGADAFLVEPVHVRELAARIRSVCRRVTRDAPVVVQQIGALRIDHGASRAYLEQEDLGLTAKEFALLARLAREPGAVVRRERLIDDLWPERVWTASKTLSVHVASLRKKLRDPEWVSTLRGVGYRLDVQR